MNPAPDAIERASQRAIAQRAFYLFQSGKVSAEIQKIMGLESEALAVDLIHEGRKLAREPEG